MSLWLLDNHRVATWRLGKRVFGYTGEQGVARGLVIAECPGPNSDPRLPMFPTPPTSAAGRLMSMSRMTPSDYLSRLICVDQCLKSWSDAEAAARCRLMIKWLMTDENQYYGTPLRVLLLGAKVQSVWSVGNRKFGYVRWADTLQITWAPHPSGMCRVYNDESARQQLARRVRWVAGLSP